MSVFTQIIQGDLPGHFVFEDELCVVILTIQPATVGHLLVIPREEIDHWDDLPDMLASHLICVAKKMAKALKVAYPSQRVGLMIAGLEVPHTHIHVMPINALSDLNITHIPFADSSQLANVAETIRQALTSI